MSITHTTATVLASGALLLGGGLATAPAALADGDTPPEVTERIEACEWIELAEGDTRWEVAFTEYHLADLGYFGDEPDQVFDAATAAAVADYQADRDIPDDGVVDDSTWEHLRSDFGEVGQGLQDEPSDRVRAVQTALIAYGLDTERADGTDGYYGDVTKASVTQFQEDVGIGADGIVGPQTYRALVTGGACEQLGLA